MTITIGRFGTDVTTNLTKVSHQGSQIQLAGLILPTSFADAQVLRQQLTGLVNSLDEPVVPVVCSDDSSLDGFYSVTAANVDLDVAGRNVNNMMPWTATIVPVPGTASRALMETTQTCALRTNPASITTASWLPYPLLPAVTNLRSGVVFSNGVQVVQISGSATRAGEVTMWGPDVSLTGTSFYPGSSWTVADLGTSNWYQGSCRFETGSNFRKVSGRVIVQDLSNWRISNGNVRAWVSNSTGIVLNVQWHNGTSWSSTKQFELTHDNTYTSFSFAPTSVSVIRNSPVAVSVRVTAGDVFFDMTIARGSRFVDCTAVFVSSIGGAGLYVWSLKASSATASTALTGGIRATSNDSDGNRFIIAVGGTVAQTNDLVNGRVTMPSVSQFQLPFGIGSEIGGSGATGQSTAQNQIFEYVAPMYETFRVVNS